MSSIRKVIFVFTVGLFIAYIFYCDHLRTSRVQQLVVSELAQMQTTVYGDNELIGYVVNQRKAPYGEDTQYAVVVKSLDPDRDDYKTICKAIVYDIYEKSHSSDFSVAIYDSTEAFELYENKFLAGMQLLNAEEEAFVGKHTVATFTTTSDYSDHIQAGTISFYQDAENGKSTEEQFTL